MRAELAACCTPRVLFCPGCNHCIDLGDFVLAHLLSHTSVSFRARRSGQHYVGTFLRV
jgi:hypothetical protein